MIRTFQVVAIALASLVVIAIGAPLLFWLRQPAGDMRQELVDDEDLLADDAGVDVDGDDQ